LGTLSACYGAARGRRSSCNALLLGVHVLGESLVWSSTTGDDGAMDIYFLLDGVTVRILTYSRTDPGENQRTGALVRVVAAS